MGRKAIRLLPGFKGYRSRPDPTTLGPGYFTLAKNIRVDDGVVALRGGQTLATSVGLAGTYKGGCLVQYGETYIFRFFAMLSAGVVKLYRQIYDSGSGWQSATEVSAGSGQYGNTRMVDATGMFSFTPVWVGYTKLVVIVQNGTDSPRCIDASAGTTATIETVPEPKQLAGGSPVFGAHGNLDITAASTATNSAGARFAASTTGSPAYWLWTFTTPTVADTAELTCDSVTVDMSVSNQVWLIADASDDTVFDNCKVEVKQSSSYYTVHDPENGQDNMRRVFTSDSSVSVYAFPIGQFAESATLGTVKGIRLTVQNAGVTAGATLKVYSVCASGRVPGLSQYAVSRRNSGTLAESKSVVLKTPFEGVGVSGIWGATASPLPDGFRLPMSEALDYSVSVPTLAPSTTYRDKGVDYCDIYRKDPGEDVFYYVDEYQTCAYSGGSWGYDSPFTSTELRQDYTDNVPTWGKSSLKTSPSAYNEPVPVARTAMYASGRLFCGASESDSHTSALLMYSAVDFPFRFQRISDPLDVGGSGSSAKLATGEAIKAFEAVSGVNIGAGPVYCVTDKSVYAVDPPYVRRVAQVGAYSIDGVCASKGVVYMVCNDGSLKRISGSVEDLSRFKSSDLDGADLATVSITAHNERVYIAFNDGADKVIVYNEALGEFESVDVPGEGPVQLLPWQFWGEDKVFSVSSDGDLFQYDSGTTDNSAQILLTLTSGEIHSENWDRIRFGPSKIVATDKASESATVTYTAKNPSASKTGTTSLDGSESTVWKVDKDASGVDPIVAGCAASASLSATLAGPFKVWSWQVAAEGGKGIGEQA